MSAVESRFTLRVCFCTLIVAFLVQTEARPQHLPLAFEQNRGQAPENVRFVTRTLGHRVEFMDAGAEVQLESGLLRVQIVGANRKATPRGSGRLDGLIRHVNVNPSKNVRNVPMFASVRYESIYPGIDLVFYGRQDKLEYEFLFGPEADPAQIRLRFEGADHLEIDETGNLVIGVAAKTLRINRPNAFQVDRLQRRSVELHYQIMEENEVTFTATPTDASSKAVPAQ